MVNRVSGHTKEKTGNLQARIADFFGFHGKATQHRSKAFSGVGERKAANASGWMSGTSTKAQGKGHSILGAITGNSSRQARGNAMSRGGGIKQHFNS